MHPQEESHEELLKHGARSFGLHFEEQQYIKLLKYIDDLVKWSRVYNISGLHNTNDITIKHILDCLAIVPSLKKYMRSRELYSLQLLDVGSGAGLPGAVLAIACPEIKVFCIDASAKKASFVQQIAGSLALANLQSQHVRVQDVCGRYEIITSRAFSSLGNFCASSQHVLAPDGVWLAMKGKFPDEEIAALPSYAEVFHVEQLEVPKLDAERCLIWMRRTFKETSHE